MHLFTPITPVSAMYIDVALELGWDIPTFVLEGLSPPSVPAWDFSSHS